MGVYTNTNNSPEKIREYKKTKEAKGNALALVNRLLENRTYKPNWTFSGDAPSATKSSRSYSPNWTYGTDYSIPVKGPYRPNWTYGSEYAPPSTSVQRNASNQKSIGNNSFIDAEYSDVVEKPAIAQDKNRIEHSPKSQKNTDTKTPRGGNVGGGARFNMGLAQAMGNMQGDSGKALDNLDKLYDPAVYTKFLNTLDSMDPQTRASLAPYMYKLGLTDEKGFLPSTAKGVDEARTRAFNNAYALDPNLTEDQVAYLKSNGEINPATGASTVKNRDYLDTAQVMLDYLYGGSPVMQDWLDYDSALRSYNQPSISYADYQNIPNKGTLYDDLEKKVQTERAKNVVSSSDVLRGIPGSLGKVGVGIFDQAQPELVETNPNSNMSLANPMSAPNPSVQLPEATPEPQTPKTYVQNKIKEKVNTPAPAPVPTPTPVVAPRPTAQEVRARKAQQDEMLRQKMLETAQNPNSSVRRNMPSYFNSSTTLQNYYLSNPDLWGRN